MRYAGLARQVDDAAAHLDDLKAGAAPDAKAVNEATRRKTAADARLEAVRKELAVAYVREATSRVEGQVADDKAALARSGS